MKLKKLGLLFLTLSLSLSLFACGNKDNSKDKEANKDTSKTEFSGDYIVDADYVKENIDNIILLDARGEAEAKKGTVEGATSTNWQYLSNVENVEKGEYDWGLILQPEELSKRLGELGLSKDKEIVLFAEGPKGWGEDARILWTLRAAGYEQLKMVDGGMNALLESGLNKTKDVKKLDPVEVKVENLDYSHVINTEELEKEVEVNSENLVIIDVREDEEWEGKTLYGEKKGGRIPGSVQIKFTDLFDGEGYLKSNEELTKMFENAGIKKDSEIVSYCTSGIRSAYTQLVLEMLGFNTSKNYDGSYNTWCFHNEVESDKK